MNDPLPDRTILIIIFSTILLIFLLIFSLKSNRIDQKNEIQWMDSSINNEFIKPI